MPIDANRIVTPHRTGSTTYSPCAHVRPLAACAVLLIAALGAACDGPAARAKLDFDRQPPGSASQVPPLEGIAGTLRYRRGCLFLDQGNGRELGLVVPAHVSFDGARLVGRLKTPEGQQISRSVGQTVSVSGARIANPGGRRYNCKTPALLITDDF